MAVFQSAVVLLLSIWSGKRSGLLIDARREMADVHKCMNMLKAAEQRWHPIGKVWSVYSSLYDETRYRRDHAFNTENRDLLYELTSVGDLPLPQSEADTRKKRARDTQGDQVDVEVDSIMSTSSNLSEPRSPPSAAPLNSNATRPLANGLNDGRSQPWHGVNVADPVLDFIQTTPSIYSEESLASGIFSNGIPPVPYQGNQRQQEQYVSSFDAYPFASDIPEHPVENGMNSSDSTSVGVPTGYQHLETGLSDTDLIDLWLNAPSGFQCVKFQSLDAKPSELTSFFLFLRLDEWSTYLSSVSTLTQQQVSGCLGEVSRMSNGYSA